MSESSKRRVGRPPGQGPPGQGPPGQPYAVPCGRPVAGRLVVPGSKSVTQRYFNLALLGNLPLVVRRPLLSDDPRLFLDALEACGFRVELTDADVRLIPVEERSAAHIFCGNGGTMFRFLAAALTTRPGTWTLDGVPRLRERPIGPLVSALRQLGAEIECPERDGYAPLSITGGSLRGGRCTLDAGSSSQYLSALLMAGQVAPEPVEIEVAALTSEPYVDLTLDAIAEFGGSVRRTENVYHLRPSRLAADELAVEADFSAVAYPAAAAMLSGGEVLIAGLNPDSRQGDRRFVDLLESMGAEIRWRTGGLEVRAGDLRAVDADLSPTPDQVPTLAALAPFAAGTTRITGVPHLRIKECDRLRAMAEELTRVGAEVEELDDGLIIPGIWARSDPPAEPVEVRTHGDHRIAMSMALIGLRRQGISIRHPEVVAKSYPDFWHHLDLLTRKAARNGHGVTGNRAEPSPAREADSDSAKRAPRCAALEDSNGVPLDQARLSDQQCVGVVLQGAALLSQLDHGGWILVGGWRDARLIRGGLLRVKSVQPGRSNQLVQVALGRLLRRLFRIEGPVSGRGAARAAARCLMARWQQVLAPTTADQAVTEILQAAPFLWKEKFAKVRATLVAEHSADGRGHLWLAGPGAARRRFLSRGRDFRRIETLLESREARDIWDGWTSGSDPLELAGRGKWRQAAIAWNRHPPRGRKNRLAYARCLYCLGRYSQTIEILKGQSHLDARLLRVWSQYSLGERHAAMVGMRRLSKADLSAEQLVELTELAIRLLAARGKLDEVEQWVAGALAETRGKLWLRANLVAVGAAWDRGDPTAMGRYLEQSREALEVDNLAGKWHHMRGLHCLLAKDGPGAVRHVSTALRLDRRRMVKAEAGRMWNDLAVSRTHVDDLPGAERASRHAARLLQDCDGSSRTTLALYNLAEVRLRRGRGQGVEPILEMSTAENRQAGNLRGLVCDLELCVRLELAQGRSVAAIARCSEALLQLDRDGQEDRRGVFEMFAARAHGWLGRRQKAADCLTRSDDESIHQLEPEERPALWALAGRYDRASSEAAGTRWAPLWSALAAGAHPASEIWTELESLEPFRAARLIFDCELLLPGVVPPSRVQQAIAVLRHCAADALAEKLENRSLSPWRALDRYLTQTNVDSTAYEELFTSAGYASARLTWILDNREIVLASGAGGGEELVYQVEAGGRLVLRAAFIDDVLRALTVLIRRDLKPPPPTASKRSALHGDGIVGESRSLRRALRRLDRLAKDDLPLLLFGESGTGKELMAKRAHRMSRRSSGPFLAINCAAVQDSLVQSDLFGHVKGSFTGADRNRPGIFESARSGTVFLDEIGDLPLVAQGKLLRVLQEREIRRIGESFARKVDVRVITATHRDLERMVSQGEFRGDLYFRLKVAIIALPPLRERGKDTLLLADHFLIQRRSTGRLSAEARARLLSYDWPGNVRELQNVLGVADTLAEDRNIGVEHLDLPRSAVESRGDYHQLVEQYRRDLISKALSEAGGNQAEAARRLGMSRQALSYMVRQLVLS